MRIKLSWPPEPLRPNARPNRWDKARAVKSYREEAWGAALAAPLSERDPLKGASTVLVHFRFHPMTRHRPDAGNAIASMKAADDGIADALGVNDRAFVITYEFAAPVKGGSVVVEVRLP